MKIKFFIFLLIFSPIVLISGVPTKACLVTAKKRVIMIDLQTKSIISSNKISDMAQPTCIDVDWRKNVAYIGTQIGSYQDYLNYVPLVIVNLSNFSIIKKYKIENIKNPYPIYFIWKSKKNEDLIYLGYSSPKYEKGSIIYNLKTKAIVRSLDIFIDDERIFSDDENYSFYYRPKKVKNNQIIRGRELDVYNIKANKKMKQIKNFKDKKNKILQNEIVQYKKKNIPYIAIDRNLTLSISDKNFVHPEKKIDLKKYINGIKSKDWNPKYIGNNIVLFNAVINNHYSIIFFDIKNKKVMKKIKLNGMPSNIVINE